MKLTNNNQWVFFDLDGTLLNSINIAYKVYLDFLHEYNIKGTLKEFNKLNGPSLTEIVKLLKNNHHLKDNLGIMHKIYLNKIQKAYQNVLPFEKSTYILESLTIKGFKLALVTSNPKKIVYPLIKKLNWQNYFSIIISGDEIINSKPSPDIYELCLKRSNALKENVIAIEDSFNGYTSASTANIRCLLIQKPTKKLVKDILNFFIHSSYEILNAKNIVIETSLKSYKITHNIIKIDRIWKREHKKNPSLINNDILTLKTIKKQNNKLLLKTEFVPYKLVLACKHDSTINFHQRPIGVSGITIIDDDEKHILFSHRASTMTAYPNKLELIPSGHIDKETKINGKIIDYESMIIKEFREESGLSVKIKNIQTLCLVKDKQKNIYDICCLILIRGNLASIINNFKSVEYKRPIPVPLSELKKFIHRNERFMVPTSLAILTYFLNSFVNNDDKLFKNKN